MCVGGVWCVLRCVRGEYEVCGVWYVRCVRGVWCVVCVVYEVCEVCCV